MKFSVSDIQKKIAEALPPGKVIPRHTEVGHFYEVAKDCDGPNPIYPSVTGKLQILKDEGLMNHKMNRAIDYVFAHYKEFTDTNVMEHLDLASRVAQDILMDAGDIGRQIHDNRERIFRKWIETGKRPAIFTMEVDPEMPVDKRLLSGLRALERFCIDYNYQPIATELLVYSHKLKVAGTLDDIGVMDRVMRSGRYGCNHDMVGTHCLHCDRKVKRMFVLMDLKSSNAFKMSYWFQVALYYEMIRKLIHVTPDQCIIVKLSKEDGTYKIEELKKLGRLVTYAKNMLKTNDGIDFVNDLRKDNQRKVAEKIEL